ncbi:MAG: LysR family transcriptional regulator [Candidatus Ventricola sp.]
MNERQIECFLAVAHGGNFTAASRQLFLSQPAVTHQIRSLEKELGVQLFERNTVHTQITPAGQAILHDAEQLYTLFQHARRQAASFTGAGSHLVLGCPEIMIEANQNSLFEIARLAQQADPPITLDSRIALKPPAHVQQLLRGEIDLLISDLSLPELQRDELACRPLFKSGVYAYLHREHPLAAQPSLTAQALSGEQLYWYADQTAFLESIRAELLTCSPLPCEDWKDSFTQAIPLLRPTRGVTFYSCPLELDAPVVCRPLSLKSPIPIGLVWMKTRKDAQLSSLIDLIAGMPRDAWRNGE